MAKFLVLVLIVWVLLSPPLFTGGDCTRLFEAEARRLEDDREALTRLDAARKYWTERKVENRYLTLDQCRRARMRFLDQCGPGPMLYVTVPVDNLICRVYRDEAVTVQLHYTEKEQLARLQVDMAPYRSLPLPLTQTAIHWGR